MKSIFASIALLTLVAVPLQACSDGGATRLAFEPEMVRIPAGSFLMGSPENEVERLASEGPQRRVSVPAFEIGKYEVTWDEWNACVADNGCNTSDQVRAGDDAGWGKGLRPVINVSRTDAQDYAKWLSRKTGKQYRLPTEAEWEYAARAGTTTRYSWGDQDPVCDERARNGANFEDCPDESTRPVGSFRANLFGLHDMHGNVVEWVQDCLNDDYTGGPVDGSAWLKGDCEHRFLRGGAWDNFPQALRSAFRDWDDRGNRFGNIGFRLARTL